MKAIALKARLLAMLLLGSALTVTAVPQSADAAELYNVQFLMENQSSSDMPLDNRYMVVNYFISNNEMYYRISSDKSPSTKTEASFEYSKDGGKTWKFFTRVNEGATKAIRFPYDPDASVVHIRTSVKFNPVVGKDTRDTIVTGPYKVYHLAPPSAGATTTLNDGSIMIMFKDTSNAEDYYRITRTGDDQTMTYKVPSSNLRSEMLSFVDKNTNTRKSTKYTYYIEPVFETVMLMPKQVPTGLTLFGESKASILGGFMRFSPEAIQSTIRVPTYREKLAPADEQEPTLYMQIPFVLNPPADGEVEQVPPQEEIDEFNQLLDDTVASASPWARNDIKSAALLNLAGGEVLNNYQAPINRAHFAGLMVKLYEQTKGEAAPEAGDSPFTDTDDPEVIKAYELGFVQGKTATTFDPYAQVTRQEIAVMLWRFAHLQGLYGQIPVQPYTPFVDQAQISSWAADQVDYTAGIGLFKGSNKGKFAPQNHLTREEAIVLIKRAYDVSISLQ